MTERDSQLLKLMFICPFFSPSDFSKTPESLAEMQGVITVSLALDRGEGFIIGQPAMKLFSLFAFQ